jgi:sugar-specific transcriptional regulator TrmB
MNEAVLVDKLMQYGLTRQEANIYLTLLVSRQLSGYEVAKITNISRSNVYSALSCLVEKGAAYLIEGNSTKYLSVPVEEFCNNKLRKLKEDKQFLIEHLPKDKPETDGYITIEGYQHILDKIRNMILQAEYRVYLSMSRSLISLITKEIQVIVDKGLKVVVLTEDEVELEGITLYRNHKTYRQLQVIVDSRYVLTGEIKETCLYSGQKNFVQALKESLGNEIKLIELTKGEK